MDKDIQDVLTKFNDFVAYFKGLKKRLPQRSLKVYIVTKVDRNETTIESVWLDEDRAREEVREDRTQNSFVEEMEVEDYRG